MSRRLPSTAALLALEAAARHQSFAKAAQELTRPDMETSSALEKFERWLLEEAMAE